MIVGVEGLGSVGLRAARELVGTTGVEVRLRSRDAGRIRTAIEALGPAATAWDAGGDAPSTVVLCGAPGGHALSARRHLDAGCSVVSTSDHPDDVAGLLALDDAARAAGVTISVGVAFSPGLSCLLARHAADGLDEVREVRVAMLGAGGPACLDRRLAAQGVPSPEWVESSWTEDPPGPSTELVWFPDPIGPTDCERGALVEPRLLHRAIPGATAISARSSVTRARRRLGRRGPQPEPVGAVRVEVSGRRDGSDAMLVYAVVDRASLAAGTVAAVIATSPPPTAGAAGLADRPDSVAVLRELARRGVKAATFEPSA